MNALPPTSPLPVPGSGIVWRNVVAGLVFLLGMTQMTGDLMGSRAWKGIGAASAASPCPKVFCDLNGVEGFACEFTLRMQTPSGLTNDIVLTPEIYQRLAGPYNRRNVYGAALAGAPILPRQIWEAVFCYGLGADGPLRRELDLPADQRVQVLIRTKTQGRNKTWTLEAPCAK